MSSVSRDLAAVNLRSLAEQILGEVGAGLDIAGFV